MPVRHLQQVYIRMYPKSRSIDPRVQPIELEHVEFEYGPMTWFRLYAKRGYIRVRTLNTVLDKMFSGQKLRARLEIPLYEKRWTYVYMEEVELAFRCPADRPGLVGAGSRRRRVLYDVEITGWPPRSKRKRPVLSRAR
jgi:hypothetical protein